MTAAGKSEASGEAGSDARWPIVFVYCFMWAGMIGISLNSDPIQLISDWLLTLA